MKSAIKNLKNNIDELKRKNSDFSCEVTFIGTPTDMIMEHIRRLKVLDTKFKELYFIAEENTQYINKKLLHNQISFSANALKSVFVNYINWSTPIPTVYTDFLTLYDPHLHITPFSLPEKFTRWWEAANKDSSILANQVETIKILSSLREYYLKKMEESVRDRKQVRKMEERLSPVKEIDGSMRSYFFGLSWAGWREK